MQEETISLNRLVELGIFKGYSYYQIRKFVLVGVAGKKLPAKITPSPFGWQGQRVEIKMSDVEAFKKHLAINRAKAIKTIA